MKRRVISFFIILVMLALILTFIEFVNFGSLNGFSIFSDRFGKARIPNVPLEDNNSMVFVLILFVFVFVASLILFKLEKHRERGHSNLIDNKQPFVRKLIPISYD